MFTFSPYRYSSSTQLTRHKIRSDNFTHPKYSKSFDPPLRTKPNYSLPKLTTQNPQQNKLSPHTLSLTLSNYPTHPNPNKFNTNKQNITQKHHTHTTHLSKFFLTTRNKTNPNKTLLKLRIIPHIPKINTLN